MTSAKNPNSVYGFGILSYSLVGKIMDENEIAKIIVNRAFEVHKRLGPGLLESVYRDCLAHLLIKDGLQVEKEKKVPIIFEDLTFSVGFRMDLFVNEKVIIEIKSVESLIDTHVAQTLTYLRLSGNRLGILINFNSALFKTSVRRVINSMPD